MRVAVLQMVSVTQWQANLDAARRLLAQASTAGAELAVLPEYFCLMGHKNTDKLKVLAQHAQGPALVLADVEREGLNAWRAQLPALNHGVL